MNQNFLKLIFLLASLSGSIADVSAQHKAAGSQEITIATAPDGSFGLSLGKEQVSAQSIEANLAGILGLSDKNSFVKTKEEKDNNNITHTTYVQYYSGIEVENSRVLVHARNGVAISINGKIMAAAATVPVLIPAIEQKDAAAIAQKELDIKKLILTYTPRLVLYPVAGQVTLAYKIRIDGVSSKYRLLMYHVYVNAANGSIINKVPLINDIDVPATAATWYSGTQSIITDSFSGGYRLRDNARRIETYNVKGQSFNQNSAPAFANPNDVVNSSTSWLAMPTLLSSTLVKAADSVRFSGLYDPNVSVMSGWVLNSSIDALVTPPSTYQNVKDGLIPEFSLMTPPTAVTLPVTDNNLNIVLAAPQYRGVFRKDSMMLSINPATFSLTEISLLQDTNVIRYDIDVLTPGTHNWVNGNGDKGYYKIAMQSNPAVDVHWGMEQTHDFYRNVFNYYSYNNDSTAVVRNYYDGIAQMSGTENNAQALPSPYFAMAYGTGDGVIMNPVVSLDVEGHEFSHLITGSNANLDYQGESGALNEAFSDMMGTAIVAYAKGIDSVTWHVGDRVPINVPYMRSFSDPKAPAAFVDTTLVKPQPDTYLGQYWADTANQGQQGDNGGVHTNSGVANKWFYLVAHGGSGTNDNQYAYSVTGLGMAKAQNIAFTTFVHYLTSTSKYYDAYTQSLQATADVYGANTTEYNTVKAAWKAVGIPRDSNLSVHNVVAGTGDINVYPNPAGSTINIKSALGQSVDACIYNISGTRVMKLSVKPGLNTYDLSSYSRGIYFIEYKSGQGQHTQKLILQ